MGDLVLYLFPQIQVDTKGNYYKITSDDFAALFSVLTTFIEALYGEFM